MEKFCGRFSLAGKEEIRSKTHNMRLYSAKMCTTNLTQTVCLRLCGELFCFSGLTRSFSWTHGSGACPAPASSTAFSGQRPGPAGTSSVRMLALPQVKKTAESKVILQQTKGAFHLNRAAKTQMEPSLGHDILLCLLPLLPEGFLENELLGPVRILGPAALCPAGDSRCNPHHRYKAVDTSCPSCTSVVSRLRYSFLPWAQVKLSSSGSYFMFSMRPTCF